MQKFNYNKSVKRNCFAHPNSPTKEMVKEKLKLFHFGMKDIGYGICKKCGLTLQTTSPTLKEIIGFYKQNFYFENFKKPELHKVESINRQISIIKRESTVFPKSILEVSLMSLYNLIQFKKNGSKILHGLEPSVSLTKKLKIKYGIKLFNDVIEKFKSKMNYDLILMSHVLEHLPNPSLAIKQCYLNQKIGQKIFVEVPLFEKTETYTASGFNVEHLYYFDENNFVNMLVQNGYEPLAIEKTYESAHLPFISVLAKKINKNNVKNQVEFFKFNYQKQLNEIIKYKKNIKKIYSKVNKVLKKIPKNNDMYLFGAGLSASSFICHSEIDKKFNIKAVFDNSSVKQNKYLCDMKIIKPQLEKLKKNSNIVITSFGTTNQILAKLSKNIKNRLNFYSFDKNFNFNQINTNKLVDERER
jgi:hypothetical protein